MEVDATCAQSAGLDRERASAQVISGVIGESSASSPISPCIAVLTDTAITSAPAVCATHSATPHRRHG